MFVSVVNQDFSCVAAEEICDEGYAALKSCNFLHLHIETASSVNKPTIHISSLHPHPRLCFVTLLESVKILTLTAV